MPNTIIITLVALFAFAANSVLCRLALNNELVSPFDFTVIRLFSAAITLGFIVLLKNHIKLTDITQYGSRAGAAYLFIYAAGFSYAYVTLGTATGALILFASVQFTMLFKAWLAGHRMNKVERIGIFLSLVGFVYFVSPQLEKPSLLGCFLMVLAGVAWGMYSLIGAKSKSPLYDTASNFIRLLPIALIGLVIMGVAATENSIHITINGWFYVIGSGALASGAGYAMWYWVLPKLTTNIAAVSQLSVPIWAALGGVIFVAEPIDLHLGISTGVILGGILLVVLNKTTNSP